MLGAVLHTVNIRLAPAQIAYTIDHAEDDVILVHSDFLPLLEEVMPLVKRDVSLILMRDDPAQLHESSFDFITNYDVMMLCQRMTSCFPILTSGCGQQPSYYWYNGRAEGCCIFTSPAGATYHGAIGWAGPIETSNRLHNGDVYMPITPMFHVHAWGFPYAATLLGIMQVYVGRYDPSKLLRLITEEGATFSHCVPTILQMLLSAPGADDTDLSNLKMLIGGSALPRGLAEAALARGINVYAGYGMSETCPVLTVSLLDPDDEAAVEPRLKTGNPIPMVDLKTVDKSMTEMPRDGVTTGEVVVRAPWLNAEYLKRPDDTRVLWEGDYLHTGDVGHIDSAGTLVITDRMKDVIKSGGEWVSSLELESLSSAVEGVADVAAIGIPDEKWGERPLLLIVARDGVEEDAIIDGIVAAAHAAVASGKMSKWAVPEQFRFVDEIFKTSVGKVDKKRLRAEFG